LRLTRLLTVGGSVEGSVGGLVGDSANYSSELSLAYQVKGSIPFSTSYNNSV
ncbi:20936_t:CDS:1, partial [Gigaspora rosea]